MDQSPSEPTNRFNGLADLYARARPSYPEAAVAYIRQTAALTPPAVIADIGCGTGISSRLFAELGFTVIGIEPNAEMRAKAGEGSSLPNLPISYQSGTAESTNLGDSSIDLVLSAQAFHWFRAPEALAEFHRILKPGSWVALMWNERDESNACTKAYGDALRLAPETASVEMQRGRAGEPLLACKLFTRAQVQTFTYVQTLDEEGLIARAFSASYAPKNEPGVGMLRRTLSAIFAKFARSGRVDLLYQTSVYLAKKP